MYTSIFGGYYTEVTPVPIPNTEVKLCSADDTWWEAARESRSPPEQRNLPQGEIPVADPFLIKYSLIAQSVERMTVNHDVVGSSPTWGAKKSNHPFGWLFF